jgi:hypothetical protein
MTSLISSLTTVTAVLGLLTAAANLLGRVIPLLKKNLKFGYRRTGDERHTHPSRHTSAVPSTEKSHRKSAGKDTSPCPTLVS